MGRVDFLLLGRRGRSGSRAGRGPEASRVATVKSGGGPGAHSPLARLNLSSRVNSNVPTSQSRQFQWHLAYGSASQRFDRSHFRGVRQLFLPGERCIRCALLYESTARVHSCTACRRLPAWYRAG